MAWRLGFALQASAQTRADSIHAHLIANVPAYAASVSAGKTTKWATVYSGALWYVNIKDRAMQALTGPEVLALELLG